jgi:signal transduction histidine kinase/CheY-like chemotaxis protein
MVATNTHASPASGRRIAAQADRPPAVLLVDDIADNLLALEAVLRRDGIEILTATSGRDALEILLEREVAVAILDVMMPDMDGFELAELIRGVERTRHVPIIFVTAAQKPYRAFIGYGTGAIDFLLKPIDERVLRAKVDVLVTLAKQQNALDRALVQTERARRETEVLLRLARAMSHGEKPTDVYDPALDAFRDLLGAERSAILLSDDSGRMRFRAWRGVSDGYRAAVDGHSPWARTERGAKPILVSDVAGDEAMASYRSIFAAEGIRAVGFVPMVFGGELVGKLVLYWDEPRAFTEHERALAATIASQVAETIGRTRLREAETRARRLLERMQSVVAGMSRARTPSEVADVACRTAGEAMEAHAAHVWLVQTDGSLALAGMWTATDTMVDQFRTIPRDSDIPAARVARTGQPEWIEREEDLAAYCVVPIEHAHKLLGVIAVAHRLPHAYEADERAFYESLAQHCGDALERARLFEEETRAREQAEQTAKFSEMFLGVVSHDLRNPLNAIGAGAHLLLVTAPDGRGRGTAGRILSSTQRMTRMIDQLLDLTRIRLGRGISIQPGPTDLGALARQIAEETEAAHGCRIVVERSDDTTGTWDGDRLGQVLSNLLSNAAIHGSSGANIIVRVDGSAPAAVELRTSNDGQVADDLLPNIFEPFRGSTQSRRTGRGLGLGLYITREIVRAHGGTIGVVSGEGGTAFVIRLPREVLHGA